MNHCMDREALVWGPSYLLHLLGYWVTWDHWMILGHWEILGHWVIWDHPSLQSILKGHRFARYGRCLWGCTQPSLRDGIGYERSYNWRHQALCWVPISPKCI